jgi:hypothetical protein
MMRCACCGDDISHRVKAGPGRPPKYCDDTQKPDCKAEREAYRKAHELARASNAYTHVVLETPETPRHRRTQDTDLAVSRWDEIAKAWGAANVWQPSVLPPNGGVPAVEADGRRLGKLQTVDRLIEEAARPRQALAIPGDHSKREDWNSPGELWLRGHFEKANKVAKRELHRLNEGLA